MLASNALFRQQLQKTDWAGDPLYLAMVTQVAVMNGVESVLSLNKTDLALRIAEREKGRILKHVPN
ncbi:MAG: hypothetical protein HQL74_11420 [Magnetococcales bacterium]|nr:hypothetical protein [Magnetococcales bacterium]